MSHSRVFLSGAIPSALENFSPIILFFYFRRANYVDLMVVLALDD